MKWNFKKLDAARQKRGDSVEMACGILSVSRSTWDNWRRGTTKPLRAALERIAKYVEGS